MNKSVLDTIITHFPSAVDCTEGHLGPIKIRWHQELADDRYYLLKIRYCGHCGIPMGETDASPAEQEAYYDGQEPPQEDF